MSILNQVATALRRRDEVPNQELAKAIADKKDKKAVQELVDNLDNKSRDIQHDCIKVLYEVAAIAPGLVATYIDAFENLLQSTNNRMVWGAMCALDNITTVRPGAIYNILPSITLAAEKGTPITKDHAVNIMVQLAGDKQYAADALVLLREQLQNTPNNQFPSYCEKVAPLISNAQKDAFIALFNERMPQLEKDSQKKRVAKALAKLNKLK